MSNKIFKVSNLIKSEIDNIIVAEPAIMQMPTDDYLVGGPLNFPSEILSLKEILEEENNPSVGPFRGIEDKEIKEMLSMIKLIHLKMDKLLLDLEEMNKKIREGRKDEN